VTFALDAINDWCLAVTRRVAFAGVIAMLAIALITTATCRCAGLRMR
jgi:hypothetical protein